MDPFTLGKDPPLPETSQEKPTGLESDAKGTDDQAGTSNSSACEHEDDTRRPATKEELETLRHVSDHIPMRVWVVATISAAERFTYWSTQVTWQNLIQYGPDDVEVQGLLGLGEAAGVSINNAFNVVVYMLPIIIGPLADGRLGRYRTLQTCNVFYLAGMVLMLACSTPTAVGAGAALPLFAVALFFMAIGLGGVQTVTSALIADQYDEMIPTITYTKTGERVVVDRDVTIHYIYSIYFWLANVASLGMIPSSLMEKYVSFWSAYAMTTGVFCLSFIVLWLGKPYFVLRPPSHTVMPHAFRVLVIAIKSKFRLDAALPEAQLELGNQVPWDATFVKDIRSGLMAVKVCLVWPILRLSLGILSTNTISQAAQMQSSNVPNNLWMALNSVALVIFGLIIENGLYPLLEKRRIFFGDMARIVVGLFFKALSMAYGTIVQALIYKSPPCYDFPMECVGSDGRTISGPNEISVLVQLPVYVIVAVSEVFAMVTGQAYAYKQAPLNMKSLLQSIYAVFNGFGYLLAMAIGPTAKNPDLVIMWASVTGVMGGATIVFWICFRSYDRRGAVQ